MVLEWEGGPAGVAPLVAVQLAVGIALGWVRQRIGSIWPGTTAHVVTNLASNLLI